MFFNIMTVGNLYILAQVDNSVLLLKVSMRNIHETEHCHKLPLRFYATSIKCKLVACFHM